MIRFSHLALFGLSTLTFMACSAPPPPPSRAADPGSQIEHLRHVVERYWDENAGLMPWYSWGEADLHFGATPGGAIAPQSLADSLALERRYLEEASAVPRSTLDAESKLTYDLFRRERLLAIEGFTYPFELLPVNPYAGMPQQFAVMASAAERLELHLDACSACRQLVADLGRGLSVLDEDRLPRPGDRLGRYAIERAVGVGGMGVVFEARDTTLDRRVAIKLVRPDSDADKHALLAEARAMAQLAHDTGRVDTSPQAASPRKDTP